MFILVVVILTLIYIIALEGVFSLIIILSSSSIRLLVFYNNRDGLILEATTNLDIYNLDIYNFNIYNFGIYSFPV